MQMFSDCPIHQTFVLHHHQKCDSLLLDDLLESWPWYCHRYDARIIVGHGDYFTLTKLVAKFVVNFMERTLIS